MLPFNVDTMTPAALALAEEILWDLKRQITRDIWEIRAQLEWWDRFIHFCHTGK